MDHVSERFCEGCRGSGVCSGRGDRHSGLCRTCGVRADHYSNRCREYCKACKGTGKPYMSRCLNGHTIYRGEDGCFPDPCPGCRGCEECEDGDLPARDPLTGLWYHEVTGPGRGPHRTQEICTRRRDP